MFRLLVCHKCNGKSDIWDAILILLNAINIRLILWSHCHCAAFSKWYLFSFICSKIGLQLCCAALTASVSHQQPALQTLTSIFLLYVIFVDIWNNKYYTVIICPPQRWLTLQYSSMATTATIGTVWCAPALEGLISSFIESNVMNKRVPWQQLQWSQRTNSTEHFRETVFSILVVLSKFWTVPLVLFMRSVYKSIRRGNQMNEEMAGRLWKWPPSFFCPEKDIYFLLFGNGRHFWRFWSPFEKTPWKMNFSSPFWYFKVYFWRWLL